MHENVILTGSLLMPQVASRQLYLAGEDVAEGREGVVQGFVVNGLVEVLDENVAHPRLPEGGVSL